MSSPPDHRARRVRTLRPYLYLAPSLGLMLFWVYRPLAETIGLAFFKWSMVPGTRPAFVGLANFAKLFSNKDFIPAIANTLFYTVGLIPFSIIIPLALATVTNGLGERAKHAYRVALFLPMVMAPVATGAIWRWILHPQNGIVNIILVALGVLDQGVAYFMDARLAKWMVLLITGWKVIGFSTIMFSSALTSVDPTTLEAARIDGAGRFSLFFRIILPLISPTVALMLTISVLFASQWTFAYVDMLTQGGPFGSSTNIYHLMYKFGFSNMNAGLSSAAATVFLAAFGGIALALNRLGKRYSFYDN